MKKMKYKYNLVHYTYSYYLVLKNGEQICLSVYSQKPNFSIATKEEISPLRIKKDNINSCDEVYVKERKSYYIFKHIIKYGTIAKIKKEDFDYILFVRTAQMANLSTISLQKILNYHDGEKALEFLKERGLSV